MSKKSQRLRMTELASRMRDRKPKFAIGEKITARALPEMPTGIVCAVYADYQTAVDVGLVMEEWYDLQRPCPRTPPGGFFYSVLLAERTVLQGEDDLVRSNVGVT